MGQSLPKTTQGKKKLRIKCKIYGSPLTSSTKLIHVTKEKTSWPQDMYF